MNNTSTNNTTPPTAVLMIRLIFIPIWSMIIIFGIFGNVLTIIVLQFRHLKVTSTAIYLTALAVADLLYLCCSTSAILIDLIFFFPGSGFKHLNPLPCRLQPILQYTVSYISVWLLVAVTFDRMVLVIFPMSAKSFSNQKNAKIVVGVISLIFTLLNLHFIWTMKFTTVCFASHFVSNIYSYIDLVIIEILPGIIMVICNAAIIVKLHKMKQIRESKFHKISNETNIPTTSKLSKKKQSNFNNNIDADNCDDKIDTIEVDKNLIKPSPIIPKRRKDKTSSLTRMLLCTNIFFMITVAPLLIYNIVYFTIDLDKIVMSNEQLWGGIIYGIERTVYTLWYVNFCIHFLLYCLSGPQFRRVALKVLRIGKSSNIEMRPETQGRI